MNTYLINSISNIIQVCTIEWMTPVHDGPVQEISKNPFMPHLLMSVGGYSFAVWNEGVMVIYIVCKSHCITLIIYCNSILLLFNMVAIYF